MRTKNNCRSLRDDNKEPSVKSRWYAALALMLMVSAARGRIETRRVTGPLPGLRGVRKYDGRPFHPAEIVEPIRLHAGAPLGEHTQVHAS